MLKLFVTAVLAMIGASCCAATATDSIAPTCASPVNLSCELLLQPLKTVIHDPRPEFAWECGESGRGYRQSAYRLVVETAAEGAAAQAVVWDSGRVASGESINVEYDGQPLAPGAAYVWRVKLWDDHDAPSGWSEPQQFRMADRLSETRTSLYPLEQTSVSASDVKTLDEGRYLVDFGRDAFGFAKLRLPASDARRVIEVRFGEKLRAGRIDRNPGGTIRYYHVSADVPPGTTEVEVRPPRDRRNTSGDAVRLPPAIGVVAPFRYLEVSEAPAGLGADDFQRVMVAYPFDDEASRFVCSDETLNRIWELCKYSIRATTFCGIYVDGDRERIPYEADAYINQLGHYGVDREFALARRSHDYLMVNPTWPTEWKQHSVLMAWADYMHTGDKEPLAKWYDALRDEKVLTAAETASGLVDTSRGDYRVIVDWPETERDDYDMLPFNTVVNAFHYATLERMTRIASALGRMADATEFAQRAERTKRSFNAWLWNDARGAYVDGVGSKHSSLHANLFPLAFGLVPDDRAASVVDFVRSRGMACSVYPAQFLLEGLYQCDQADYALQLLASRDKRSWANMIAVGSTITLEAWDIDFKPNLDWNHAWGAAPANLIPFYLVGVQPEEPGFGKIRIQPRPGGLWWFQARVPTVRGPVEVAYKTTDEGTSLDVLVPGNVVATIAMPLSDNPTRTNVELDGRETPTVVRGAHLWIENVPPGKHVVVLTNASPARRTVGLVVPE